VTGGLLVGQDLHRPVAGLPGEGDGLVGLARTGRLGEVMGQLGQVAFEVVTAELDQGRAHPVVQLPPFPGRQLPVQRLADQGVREPEPARPAGHQPGVHGLLQESRTSSGGRPVTPATTSRSKSRPWTDAAARPVSAASESRRGGPWG
jgi:hypothetical protein